MKGFKKLIGTSKTIQGICVGLFGVIIVGAGVGLGYAVINDIDSNLNSSMEESVDSIIEDSSSFLKDSSSENASSEDSSIEDSSEESSSEDSSSEDSSIEDSSEESSSEDSSSEDSSIEDSSEESSWEDSSSEDSSIEDSTEESSSEDSSSEDSSIEDSTEESSSEESSSEDSSIDDSSEESSSEESSSEDSSIDDSSEESSSEESSSEDSSIEDSSEESSLEESSSEDSSIEDSSEESSSEDSSSEDSSIEDSSDSSAPHEHDFSKEIIENTYLMSEATCDSKAIYYYACDCGERGEETFGYGLKLGHNIQEHEARAATCVNVGWNAYQTCTRCDYNTYVEIPATGVHTWNDGEITTQPTCVREGVKTFTCTVCTTGTKTENVPATGVHTWNDGEITTQPTCVREGVKTFTCTVCTTETTTEVVDKLPHQYANTWTISATHHWHECNCGDRADEELHRSSISVSATTKEICAVCGYVMQEEAGILFNTLSGNGAILSKTVSNGTQIFSFAQEITIIGAANFVVSSDKAGKNTLGERISLNVGDNVVYITEFVNGKANKVYTIEIRRKPMYTVTFNANGGTAVESQTVEEGEMINSPTSTRAGYALVGWGYDFSQPIVANATLTAVWVPNIDTQYVVNYYLQNVENDGYSLHESQTLSGTTASKVTARIRRYNHFTYKADKSVISGNILADGSLVLSVYYTRDTYTLSINNGSLGSVTDCGAHKYGKAMNVVANAYVGCDFLGWYHGEELLATTTSYSFTMEKEVVAKFASKKELADFYFVANVNSCTITGVKNTTSTSLTVPSWVTAIGERAFYNCNNLTSIIIPKGVQVIGTEAFRNCSNLTIYCEAESQPSGWDSGWNCSECPVVWGYTVVITVNGVNYTIKNGKAVVVRQALDITTAAILDSIPYNGVNYSVTEIAEGAFENCRNLTNIVIPDSVITIGTKAFTYCINLTEITIGSGVQWIGKEVFTGCESLEAIIFASPSSWRRVTDADKWKNKTGGKSVVVTNPSKNVTNFKETYDESYWYKL